MNKITRYEWIKNMSFDEMVLFLSEWTKHDEKLYKKALIFYPKYLKEKIKTKGQEQHSCP